MGLPDLYPAQVGSPYTSLAAPYTTGDTTLTVVDATKLPDAPNIVCLAGSVAGEFRYSGKDGNTLLGVVELPGTPNATWPAGTFAFRGIAAYDLNALIANVVSKEPAFAKNSAFNKDFGTTAGTVCQGNDPRLSDSRDPKPHTHGGTDITSTVADADKVDGYHAADLPAYVQGQNLPIRTLVLQGASLIVPDTNGAKIVTETLPGGRLIRGASFGASASDITAQIGHPMPANWDGGTVTAQFLFATAATAGTVKFSLAGRASVSDNGLDQAFGTPQSATLDIAAQPGKAAWDLWTTDPTNPITLAGSPQGPGRRWVQWKITRDAADTCAYDVLLLAVVIEYGTDGYSDA